MLTTIEDITARIVETYDPDRIILFGSRAHGTGDAGSDVDLLILKDSTERPLDRRMDLESRLMDRMLPVDLFVYTPEEVRYLYSIGSPFVEEIMETGKVLYMKKPTESWIKDARDECESAGVLLKHGKYRASCYHSQQCVEKALKSIIIESGNKPERIHDIVGLMNTVKGLGITVEIPSADIVLLNSVYKGRYPTEDGLLPYGDPSQEDTEKAYSAAGGALESIEAYFSGKG